jgi:hypothetical protein
MSHGGKRIGAGRRAGSAHKRTREIADKAVQEGITPLEVMLKIMRAADGRGDEEVSLEAAFKAAPYVHAKFAQVEIGNKDGDPFKTQEVSSDDRGLLKRFFKTKGQELLKEDDNE